MLASRSTVWLLLLSGVVATSASGQLLPDEDQRQWWAFQPLQRPATPGANRALGGSQAIDAFIEARRKNANLSSSPPANRAALLRRLKFVLLGLPPTPAETADFVQDESPLAFERLVDRFLASPHFGEHWGRHWLDVVRYADYRSPQPDGVMGPGKENFDFEFYEAFRYRDWVVDAFNRDMPFDAFITHQLAGDLLPSPAGSEFYADGLIATTVLSIGVWDNADADKKKIVSDIVDDQINLVGKAFLGLTLACARCHDHKFDPISQDDYYGLAGIFYSTRILKDVGIVGLHTNALRVPLARREYLDQRATELARIAKIEEELAALDQNASQAAAGAGDVQEQEPPTESRSEREALQAELQQLKDELLPAPPTALAAQEGVIPGGVFEQPGDVPVHYVGRYDSLGDIVPRRMPTFFAGDEQPPIAGGSGRIELARWVASGDNPLTARVLANRVWQHIFGEGLVRTPNNFGLSGERPSHPELLDWLAAELIESGWSVKHLVRLIVNTEAFQQASGTPAPQDPENRLLACYVPRRATAEQLRDAMLAVAGRLEPQLGGPATQDLHRPRRSLYIQTVRQDRRNFSTLFDAADPEQCVGRRNVTTTGPQALFFLNNQFVIEQAGRLAERVLRAARDDPARIVHAYLLLFSRTPTAREAALGEAFLQDAAARDSVSAWREYFHVLLSTNEFAYIQ